MSKKKWEKSSIGGWGSCRSKAERGFKFPVPQMVHCFPFFGHKDQIGSRISDFSWETCGRENSTCVNTATSAKPDIIDAHLCPTHLESLESIKKKAQAPSACEVTVISPESGLAQGVLNKKPLLGLLAAWCVCFVSFLSYVQRFLFSKFAVGPRQHYFKIYL